jgi:hypothetical protein
MNAFAQVRHLFVNDVRRLRWMLVAYAACVVLATVGATSFAGRSPGWQMMTPVLVLVTGLFLLASAVQADSPYRPDAFWVSKPIQPAAVLGAKLALATLVVALPVAGLTWTLIQIGFPSSEFGSALGPASLSFASWLLLGMAIAAVTHDLRSFANVLVGLAALSLIGYAALLRRSGSNFGSSEIATSLATALSCVGPLAVLVLVYLKRDSVKRARAIGGALLAASFVVLPFSTPPGYPVDTKVMTLRPDEAPQVTLILDRASPGDGPETVRFHVSGKPWRDADRLVVSVNSMQVHARDGETFQLQRVPALVVRLHDPVPDGVEFRDFAVDSSYVLRLGEGELRRLASGIESIELVGNVEPFAARVAAALPFASGATVQQGGIWLQLDSVQRDPVVSSAVATTITVRTDRQDMVKESQLASVLPRFVLLDDSAHRASRLYSQSSGRTSSSAWMVLPGTSIIRRWTNVNARWPSAGTGSALAPARFIWLDWKSLGRAPLRLRAERE